MTFSNLLRECKRHQMPHAKSVPSARMALVAFGVDLAMNHATTKTTTPKLCLFIFMFRYILINLKHSLILVFLSLEKFVIS